MRMNKFMASVALATAVMAGIALGPNSASAATLYDNLGATSGGVDGASVSGQANSFGPLYTILDWQFGFLFDSLKLLLALSIRAMAGLLLFRSGATIPPRPVF